MIVSHFSLVEWHPERWPNFSPAEVSCHHCGEIYYAPDQFDQSQRMRDDLGIPMRINSAHRCLLHNRQVGGAARSMHKQIAFDISLHGHNKENLLQAAVRAGFIGYGFYGSFLHVDMGRPRKWATKAGEKVWNGLVMSLA